MPQPPGTLMLQAASGPILLPSTSFVVFVDETGDDSMRDTAYPIFGLCGCATLARYFHDSVDSPWMELKAAHFPQQKGSIRAAKIRRMSERRLSVLSRFFEDQEFFRLAVVMTTRTRNTTKFDSYKLLARYLIEKMIPQVLTILRDLSDVAIIFEQSARGDSQIRKYFNDLMTTIQRNREIPVRYFFLPKISATPGLEIADWIAHSVGAHVLAQFASSTGAKNALFSSMFQKPDPKWVCFSEIQTMEYTQR